MTMLRHYLAHLRDSRTEVAIRLAVAALILALGDRVLTALLAALVPDWHLAWTSLEQSTRRWLAGAPAALAWLAGGVIADLQRLRP